MTGDKSAAKLALRCVQALGLTVGSGFVVLQFDCFAFHAVLKEGNFQMNTS
jgi:hypothetical protein